MSRHVHPGVPAPRRGLVQRGRPRVVARTADGQAISRDKLLTLAELATWPNGTGAIFGQLEGGSLSALVQLGLAKRVGPDRIGGLRYKINAAGLDLLTRLGVLQEVERGRG